MRWLATLGFRGDLLRRGDEAVSESDIAADIAEELAHHLQSSAASLIDEGMSAAEAEQEARRRFGEVDRIQHACLHTQIGRRTMRRKMHVLLTAGLIVSLGMLAWGSHVQVTRERDVAHRMMMEAKELAAELQLAEQGRRLTPVENLELQVGDLVEIVFEDFPGMSTIERIGRDGMLLVPGAGWMNLAGKTRSDAEAEVTLAAKQYFVLESPVRLVVDPYVPATIPGANRSIDRP